MIGGFFAVGKSQWTKACKLGLNPAVAFLVLARGTGRDNVTTRWSANAVEHHASMSWRRANDAISELVRAKLVTSTTNVSKTPLRKLTFPENVEQALWLPNTLIDGVGRKSSSVARLRQTQSVEYLQAFIELYGLHDLTGDGGLPRTLIRASFTRTHICDTGQFKVYGFDRDRRTCRSSGPLSRFADKKVGDEWASWHFLIALENMGLLETADYLAEGDSDEAELIHPLSGDVDSCALADAAAQAVLNLPDWVSHRSESHDYVIPVIRDIPAPAVVGVSRLTFRPHTGLTAAWWARQQESCLRFNAIYRAIASGDYKAAVAA